MLQNRSLTARRTGRHIQGDPVFALWWTLKTCCVATNKFLLRFIFLENLYQAMTFLVNIYAPKPFIDCPPYRQTYTGWSSICPLMNPEDILCSHEQVSVAIYISWKFIPSHDIFSHQERIQLYLQRLVFVTPLLLSADIVEELELVWVCCVWRTRDRPACSVVPQTIAPPRAPKTSLVPEGNIAEKKLQNVVFFVTNFLLSPALVQSHQSVPSNFLCFHLYWLGPLCWS
jgi:hypothetical protein